MAQDFERTMTIKDVEERTGISAFTIRYYDSCGFFPMLQRSKGGIRRFSERDLQDLSLVDALHRSGLSIEDIQYVMQIRSKPSKRTDLQHILESQIAMLEIQRDQINESLKFLESYMQDLHGNQ